MQTTSNYQTDRLESLDSKEEPSISTRRCGDVKRGHLSSEAVGKTVRMSGVTAVSMPFPDSAGRHGNEAKHDS